ncbi:MAG: ATP-binding protein [Dehalococcoidia bacterium]
MNDQRRFGYAVAAASVCLVTGVIAVIDNQTRVANISMLYLVAVIAMAVFFGQGPAIFASLAAFLAFDVFFIHPRYTLTVSDPSEWVALGLFLVTAVITGQLAARQRLRAIEAEQRERETALLYDLARLLANVDLRAGLAAAAGRLCDELSLMAVGVVLQGSDAAEPDVIEVGDPEAFPAIRTAAVAPARLLMEGAAPTATSRGGAGRWIRAVPAKGAARARGDYRPELVPIRAGSQRVGSLVVVRRSDADAAAETRLLPSVAAQIGAAVQLERLRGEANEAEALRRTDELKSALLNAVSHDLRSPLAAIIASAGSLQQTDVAWTDSERQDFAEGIESEAQRLNRLVGNLLDLSRIESGSLKPDLGWYDLGSLVQEVAGRLKPVLAAHQLRLELPEELPPIALDYIEIDEVLTNLIENAVKYTPPGSTIELSVRCDGDDVLVTVADNGPGIPEMALPRLFEAFYRAPGSKAKGTGLGLAVARGLVEAHGGRIWATNRDGGGAAISFTLPRNNAVPALEKEN